MECHLAKARCHDMTRRIGLGAVLWTASAALLGCPAEAPQDANSGVADALPMGELEPEWLECAADVSRVREEPEVPGAPTFDDARIDFLGRARGEAMLFVRTPQATPDDDLGPLEAQSRRGFETGRPGGRVISLQQRFKRQPEALRRLLLREGYAYFDDALDGHWFARRVSLTDLFDADRIFLQRGAEIFELERRGGPRWPRYVHTDGAREGEREVVLFGDRVAANRDELEVPLHRDVVGFARDQRLDRLEPLHHTEEAMVARLWRGDESVVALLEADGAKLELACINEPEKTRRAFAASFEARAERAEIHAHIAEAIDAFESEKPEFDRPRGVEGPDRDGELRPYWMSAYLGGRHGYEVEEERYTVYLPDGRPNPPLVCVDLVLNVYERASGTWFAPRGDKPARIIGSLDFNALGMQNRRGVLALGEFAENNPALFDYHRFDDSERVAFRKRDAFFEFVQDKALLEPGDIVTIQGLKPDGRVHQHAIFVEAVDPITGFPHALADKLGGSYRSTWEDVMGEAPKRSVLYRARPTDLLWSKMVRN